MIRSWVCVIFFPSAPILSPHRDVYLTYTAAQPHYFTLFLNQYTFYNKTHQNWQKQPQLEILTIFDEHFLLIAVKTLRHSDIKFYNMFSPSVSLNTFNLWVPKRGHIWKKKSTLQQVGILFNENHTYFFGQKSLFFEFLEYCAKQSLHMAVTTFQYHFFYVSYHQLKIFC